MDGSNVAICEVLQQNKKRNKKLRIPICSRNPITYDNVSNFSKANFPHECFLEILRFLSFRLTQTVTAKLWHKTCWQGSLLNE